MTKTSAYGERAVADTYVRLAEPTQFEPPARDLVTFLRIAPGHVVLDVGTGTGIVSAHALAAAGPRGRVFGVDRSLQMLRAAPTARDSRSHGRIAGEIPGLPFADASFDRVAGGFVLSHFKDYGAGLRDMVRVCRPGGLVGASAWGSLLNPPGELWSSIALALVPAARFRDEFRTEVPWEDWFADPAHIEEAFRDAGLASVEVARREYEYALDTAAYLEVRENGVQGSIVRRLLGARWDAFRQETAAAFAERFGGTVQWVRDVRFTIGTRAS